MKTIDSFGQLALLRLLLPALAMLGLCVLADAQLEAALADWLGGMAPGSRALLLTNLVLGALALPPLCAAGLLWRAHGRRHAGQAG